MAIPATRTNRATNPSLTTATTGYLPYGSGSPAVSWQAGAGAVGNGFGRITFGVAAAAGDGGWYGADTATTAGSVLTLSAYVRASKSTRVSLGVEWRTASAMVSQTLGPEVILPANEWVRVYVENATAPATTTVARLIVGARGGTGTVAWAAADKFDLDGVLVESAPTLGVYFDGGFPGGGNYTSAWTGAANASTSTRDYYGIWAEQVIGPGAPKVQVSAIGLGGVAADTQVTRQCGRELWSVPGWKKRNSLSADTYTDATPPLGRPVTYTLLKDGLTVNSITLTVESTTGWIMDPLSPGTAMPVATTDGNPNVLALGKAALKAATYAVRYEEETPLGGQYPIVRAEPRGGASGVEFHLNAYTNAVSDALQQLVLDAPVLLFRGLPSWGSIPALAYLIGDVQEAPFNRDRGGQFTAWVAGGKLTTPVALGPIVGVITNQMVQDNLAGRTNASIQSTTGSKRNIDVQANPLGLGQ